MAEAGRGDVIAPRIHYWFLRDSSIVGVTFAVTTWDSGPGLFIWLELTLIWSAGAMVYWTRAW